MGGMCDRPMVEPSMVESTGRAPVQSGPTNAGSWSEATLPDIVVVRKEARELSKAEQDRFVAAVMKMRENLTGPGTSLYFKLACIHGGFPPLPKSQAPEYCAHGQNAFPTWHRPYMMDFERALRRADMALGGDGNIGLPYWDWTRTTVQGQVLPGVVKKICETEFPSDFFPVAPAPTRHQFKFSATNSDRQIAAQLDRSNISKTAHDCLHSVNYMNFASTRHGSNRHPTVESPHNSIHGIVGGIMGTFQSSFHPCFWLHHNNVDRIFETYIGHETDSLDEFEARENNDFKFRGFPEGPWGRYDPFKHPKTGAPFEANDCFDSKKIGFKYDKLLDIIPPEMREPPYFAVFSGVDVKKLKNSCNLFIYVYKASEQWTAPTAYDPEALVSHPGFAGMGGIFFLALPGGGCENCADRPPFNVFVDITKALRSANLPPSKAKLGVIVVDAEGVQTPLAGSGVPTPEIKGPRFFMQGNMEDSHDDDIAALQKLLVYRKHHAGELSSKTLCASTQAAVKKAQKAAGLPVTGKVDDALKKAMLLAAGLHTDKTMAERLQAKPGDCIHWRLDVRSVPKCLPKEEVIKELQTAFYAWGTAANLQFELTEDPAKAKLTIGWCDQHQKGEFTFDGPGGSLAEASPTGIMFDSAERWELTGRPHKKRQVVNWDEQYFSLLAVAMHEMGHVLGLDHSEEPADVMCPYYVKDRTKLSANDVARIKALVK